MFAVLFFLLAALLVIVGLKLLFFAMHLVFSALLMLAVVTMFVGIGFFLLRKA